MRFGKYTALSIIPTSDHRLVAFESPIPLGFDVAGEAGLSAQIGLVTINLQAMEFCQLTWKGSAHRGSQYNKETSDLMNLWLAIGMDRW